MSETEFNAHFFEQFLDDYFAEAEEHLRSVRRGVLDLEDSSTADRPVEKGTLDELFRSFHTLKGISAMAGVSPAESLAHHMESYLRLLRDGQAPVSAEGLAALVRSTKKLEQIVAAKRGAVELPPIGDEAALLESLVSASQSAAVPTAEPLGAAVPASAATLPRYVFTFVSAPELAARDVTVNSVRTRLQQIGTIVKSTPTVRANGQVAFEFLVDTADDPATFESWSADGIQYERAVADGPGETAGGPELPDIGSIAVPGHSNFVRVELSRLDDLMLMVGELVVSRSKLAEQVKRIGHGLPSEQLSDLEETDHTIERQLRNLRDAVMRTRMTPIGEVFERLQFAVRDLARESGKKISLRTTGDGTEIDKMLVEKLLDPLLHLVRNAVSHGIEDAPERAAKGKPEFGTIRLHAETVGESIVLEVSDDGAGVDVEKVAARAAERGLGYDGDEPAGAALFEILCSPGFSTRDDADRTSGRGVGMDVVRRAIDDLDGTVSLQTGADFGTKFTIQLPLTLAIADALIVSVDRERYAVPQAGVREVIEVRQSAVRRLENNEIIEYRGAALPLVRLSELFALEDGRRETFHAFVVGEGEKAVGVAVDRIIGQAEIVIRSVSDPLTQVPGVTGATELGDGRIVLILDAAAVARRLEQKL